jgi:hypothetical protein
MSLEQIADNTKTDKNTVNSYLPLYKQQTPAQAKGARGFRGKRVVCKVLAEAVAKCLRKQSLLPRVLGDGLWHPRCQKLNAAQASAKGRVWWGQGETYSHGVEAGAGPAVSKAYRYVNDAYHTEHPQQSHHRLRCVD